MIVCLCNNITETDISDAACNGYKNFDSMIKVRGLKFQCRSCVQYMKDRFKQTSKEKNNEPR